MLTLNKKYALLYWKAYLLQGKNNVFYILQLVFSSTLGFVTRAEMRESQIVVSWSVGISFQARRILLWISIYNLLVVSDGDSAKQRITERYLSHFSIPVCDVFIVDMFSFVRVVFSSQFAHDENGFEHQESISADHRNTARREILFMRMSKCNKILLLCRNIVYTRFF